MGVLCAIHLCGAARPAARFAPTPSHIRFWSGSSVAYHHGNITGHGRMLSCHCHDQPAVSRRYLAPLCISSLCASLSSPHWPHEASWGLALASRPPRAPTSMHPHGERQHRASQHRHAGEVANQKAPARRAGGRWWSRGPTPTRDRRRAEREREREERERKKEVVLDHDKRARAAGAGARADAGAGASLAGRVPSYLLTTQCACCDAIPSRTSGGGRHVRAETPELWGGGREKRSSKCGGGAGRVHAMPPQQSSQVTICVAGATRAGVHAESIPLSLAGLAGPCCDGACYVRSCVPSPSSLQVWPAVGCQLGTQKGERGGKRRTWADTSLCCCRRREGEGKRADSDCAGRGRCLLLHVAPRASTKHGQMSTRTSDGPTDDRRSGASQPASQPGVG